VPAVIANEACRPPVIDDSPDVIVIAEFHDAPELTDVLNLIVVELVISAMVKLEDPSVLMDGELL
jgi:hypothetical protein